MVVRQCLVLLIFCVLIFPAVAAEPEIWLRLQGSNTVGAHLAPSWAKAFLTQRGISDVRIEPTTIDNEFLVSGFDRNGGSARRVGISVAAHGTATGFQALATHQTDIAMASRAIKSEEREALHEFGDMESARAEHAIAIDGVAILVNPANPLGKLSRTQIAGLFSGAIQNWKEIGGADRPVTIYARDERSGTWETFRELVLGKNLTLAASARRLESSDQLSDAVSADPDAIGFAGLASVRKAKAVAVADGATRALRPTQLSVATEDYALSRRLYLYIPEKNQAEPQRTLAQAFVDFCQSGSGQQIVTTTGFVSQNIETVDSASGDGDAKVPQRYRDLMQSAQRLSLNFRFKQGNSVLDNKALRDIDRLTQFLQQPENRKQRVYLIGFSNTERNEKQDGVISRFRALAVRAALMQREVPVFGIEGFGAHMPVAENAEVAAAKNGRVEVWLAPPG